MNRTFLAAGIALLAGCGGGGGSSDAPGGPAGLDPASATASYRLRFEASWSDASHPTNFPPGPHFSGLIGATHSEQLRIWEPGQLASVGIESMAETGAKSTLEAEIEQARANGLAEHLISGAGIARSPGQVSVEFEISRDFDRLSIVSMLAPSPDWFVGTQSLALRDASGWIETTSVELALFDAGTDSGARYASANADTQPPAPIALLTSDAMDTDFVDGLPMVGRFVIQRLE